MVVPLPGRTKVQRIYCRLVLRCFGVRITVSGSPIRNLRGVLVVSGHISWLDAFCIGAVLPGSFVARADMFTGGAIGVVARIMKIIPIERASLRRLPAVVDPVARRLRAGHTVVAFPEGTTWCGRNGGPGARTRVGILLPGDVPGRDRRRPAGAAAAAELPPRRRQRVHRPGVRRRRRAAALDPPAAHRAAHGGAGARRIPAAAGHQSARSGPPLPDGGVQDTAAPRTRVTGTPWSPERGSPCLGTHWTV